MVFLLVLLVVILFISYLVVREWERPVLPGPRGIPFLGNALNLIQQPTELVNVLQEIINQYQGIFEFNLVGKRYAIVSEPEAAEPILSSPIHIKKGTLEYSFWKEFLREGLLISDGAKWHFRRKLLTPTFHFKILEDAMDTLSKHSELLANQLLATNGGPVEIDDLIRTTTLDVICATAMGLEKEGQEKNQRQYMEVVKRIPETISKRFSTFWLHSNLIYKLTKAGKDYYQDLKTAHAFTKEVISSRRKLFEEKKSLKNEKRNNRKAFLDSLLEIESLNGIAFTEEDICEEVDTFMFEGHDTTSANLILTLFLIANHPEVQEKIAEEMIEIFGESNRLPTMQDLTKMNYLEMVIKEALRLYPSVPLFSRTLTEDLKISEDVTIPAGYTAVVPAYFIHRSSKHWDNPEEFRPERFAPGTPRHPFAFIPFSAGPRNCIGQKFAMMEVKTLLSTIIRKCKLTAVTKKVDIILSGIIKTEKPIFLKIFPRDDCSKIDETNIH